MKKRLTLGIFIGGILGVFCIIGASLRNPDQLSSIYLFSFWYNRVIMGFIIGLLPRLKSFKHVFLRGLIIGGLVSFAFYGATEFKDLLGFLAGFAYGIIIEITLFKLIDTKENLK